jgi:DNA-binding MarR family transcriptional regulator
MKQVDLEDYPGVRCENCGHVALNRTERFILQAIKSAGEIQAAALRERSGISRGYLVKIVARLKAKKLIKGIATGWYAPA